MGDVMKALLEISLSILLVVIEFAVLAAILAPRAVARWLWALVRGAFAPAARWLGPRRWRSRDRRPLQPPQEVG
jgi:hypothetical protein